MTADQLKAIKLFEDKADDEEWYSTDQVADKLKMKRGVARKLLSRLCLLGVLERSSAEGRLIFNLAE